MIATDLDGPRLGELLLGELVGRSLGTLESVSVSGVDHPAGGSCAVGERYDVTADGERLAMVAIDEAAVRIRREPDGPVLRVEDGARVKAAVDVIAAWVG